MDVGRTPVVIGNAKAHIGGPLAGPDVIIGHGPHRCAGVPLLPRHDHRFRRVDGGDDHVDARIEEIPGYLGGVGGDAGNVEPEADPGDPEGQVPRVPAEHLFPGIARPQVGGNGEPPGLLVDQGPQVTDFTRFRGHGRGEPVHHPGILHPSEKVGKVLRRPARQDVVSRNVKEVRLRMTCRGLPDAVLHVIGIGDDQLRPFFHHVVHQLGNGDPRAVGGIDPVDVDHFRAGNPFFHVPPTLVVSLAVPPVVVRPHEEEAEDERRVRGGSRARRKEERQARRQPQDPFPHSFFHGFLTPRGDRESGGRHGRLSGGFQVNYRYPRKTGAKIGQGFFARPWYSAATW